jgi:hypothetical protein
MTKARVFYTVVAILTIAINILSWFLHILFFSAGITTGISLMLQLLPWLKKNNWIEE